MKTQKYRLKISGMMNSRVLTVKTKREAIEIAKQESCGEEYWLIPVGRTRTKSDVKFIIEGWVVNADNPAKMIIWRQDITEQAHDKYFDGVKITTDFLMEFVLRMGTAEMEAEGYDPHKILLISARSTDVDNGDEVHLSYPQLLARAELGRRAVKHALH